jgi:hypothetical protein
MPLSFALLALLILASVIAVIDWLMSKSNNTVLVAMALVIVTGLIIEGIITQWK